MVSAIFSQTPEDGGKVPSLLLSPYGQIGSATPPKVKSDIAKKELDLPAMEVDKVPLGAIPREEHSPYSRFYLSGEYIGWKLNNTTVNPILFNVPVGILQVRPATFIVERDRPTRGIFAEPQSASLLLQSQAQLSQNGIIDYGIQSGYRLGAGYVLEQDSGLAIVGNVIMLPKDSYYLSSVTGLNDFPILLQTGFSDTINIVLPPVAGGSASLQTQTYAITLARQVDSTIFANASAFVGGAEINARGRDLYMGDMNFSGVLGFRYFQLQEALNVNSQYTILRPDGVFDPLSLDFTVPININSKSNDQIKVYNHFIGPQIGFNADFNFDRWSVMTGVKLGIGVMHQVAKINSRTTQTVTTETSSLSQNGQGIITTTTNTSTTTSAGGLLFSPLDVGQYSRNQFGLLPEINAKLGFKATERIKLTVGYDFLLLANVLRAANQTQIIPYTNQLNVTGNGSTQSLSQSLQIPAFQYSTSNLIINGVNAGLQLDF